MPWPPRWRGRLRDYTDVDGIFTADPRIVPDAQRLAAITYEEMLEMAACGAKVLHLRAVEYARRYNVPLRVRSSYNEKPGSLVSGSIEEIPVEQAIITGVAHDRSEAKITVIGVPDTPGMAARIFRTVAESDINIDMVLQNISHDGADHTDITFTLSRADGPRALAALTAAQPEIGFDRLLHDDRIGKVSLVGAGCAITPGSPRRSARRCRRRDQNRDHEHVGDPDLGRFCPEGAARPGGGRAARRVSSWAATSWPCGTPGPER